MANKGDHKKRVKKPKKLSMKQSLAALHARVVEIEEFLKTIAVAGAKGERGEPGAKGEAGTFRWFWE